MNILLFSPSEVELPLARQDARAQHLLGTLRRQPGDKFDAGILNGPRGKGTLVAVRETALELSFAWGETPPPPAAIHLLVGLPRPQTARDILRDATTLGVASIHFVRGEKGEASYASSSLWQSGEWQRHVIAGAAQAFCTRVPAITHGQTLADTLALPPTAAEPDGTRLVLDNYEAAEALSVCNVLRYKPVCLALGSERGWSANERELFRTHGFTLAHLGPRVLRTETAVVAAITLVKAKLGLL